MLKKTIILIFVLVALIQPALSFAGTACARVSVEIEQELTLERIAFDAKLVIKNNLPDQGLTNVRVDVIVRDENDNIKNDLFFIKTSEMYNITDVSGGGSVAANTEAEAHWLIIPSPGSGGDDENGRYYFVGATLTYKVGEVDEVVSIMPDRIQIKPQPMMVLDYFMPYEVLGDNPFTAPVEAPVPFPLGLRILNDGYGPANNMKIESAQPKIVDNKQGLLVNFQILGSQVNDSEVAPTLTADFGNLGGKDVATASWEMIATLSGKFVEFGVEFSHASELGGELTSLIQETNANYLTHMVKINLPYRDQVLDFLADTDRDAEHLPDAIFESEIPNGSTDAADAMQEVFIGSLTNAPERPTMENPEVEVKVIATCDSGWVYARLSDPANGMLNLIDVVRKDGVHLDPHNFWIEKKLDEDYKEIFNLHMLDYKESNLIDGTYTLVYEQPDDDITSPVTTLVYDGYAVAGDPMLIAPDTRVVFIASDNDGGSGVDFMMKQEVGSDANFVPALPFNLRDEGTYTLNYYSVDAAGNTEATKIVNITVDDAAPVISSFNVTPSVIIPHAPEGISAVRSTSLNVSATDNVSSLPVTIEISEGETFDESSIVRTIAGEVASGIQSAFPWDGAGDDGKLVATGKYTARVTVSDGLGDEFDTNHLSTSTVAIEVAEWFSGDEVAGTGDGEQRHPAISGTRVVWQDNRADNWDIYYKDLPGGADTAVTIDTSDQTRPDVDGGRIVWQDGRNDSGDIYGYDTATDQEIAICTDGGSQERPVLSGDWVVWQDSSAGNWDIYAYNFSTMEKVRITSHERDQMNPSIDGSTILWQDYRHGLGEIYGFDLDSRVETRLTNNIDNQTSPVVSGDIYVWTDHRNGGMDLYLRDAEGNETRVTYGAGDEADADIKGGTIVYTDFTNGLDDPNLAFYDMTTGLGGILNANPARQEEAAIGDGYVAWQDNRTGNYRIYVSDFEVVAVPLKATIKPGLNLIAVGGDLTLQYPSVSAFVGAYGDSLGIDKVMTLDALHGTYTEFEYDGIATSGEDFALTSGMALLVYASKDGVVTVAESGEAVSYTLLPGANEIGILSVPLGYKAYDLMTSIGLDKIQSVRRFNVARGSWETAAVDRSGEAGTLVGINFDVKVGEGLAITMMERVDGWKP